MNTGTVIYSQTYTHQGREFLVWSYLAANEEGSVMLFAHQCYGATVEGLPDRGTAVRQARKHLDALPAEPAEEAPVAEALQALQGQQQQAELALA
jgi:hypothetical protein